MEYFHENLNSFAFVFLVNILQLGNWKQFSSHYLQNTPFLPKPPTPPKTLPKTPNCNIKPLRSFKLAEHSELAELSSPRTFSWMTHLLYSLFKAASLKEKQQTVFKFLFRILTVWKICSKPETSSNFLHGVMKVQYLTDVSLVFV